MISRFAISSHGNLISPGTSSTFSRTFRGRFRLVRTMSFIHTIIITFLSPWIGVYSRGVVFQFFPLPILLRTRTGYTCWISIRHVLGFLAQSTNFRVALVSMRCFTFVPMLAFFFYSLLERAWDLQEDNPLLFACHGAGHFWFALGNMFSNLRKPLALGTVSTRPSSFHVHSAWRQKALDYLDKELVNYLLLLLLHVNFLVHHYSHSCVNLSARVFLCV